MTASVKRKPTDDEIIAQLADGKAESIGSIVWLLERNAHVKTSETTVKPLVLALVAAGRLAAVSYKVNNGALPLVRGNYRHNATYYGLASEVTRAHNAHRDQLIARANASKLVADMRHAPADLRSSALAEAEISYDGDGRIRITLSQDAARRLWGLS